MKRIIPTILLLLSTAAAAVAQVPHPRDVFGFTPGDDYKIADYAQMLEYYGRLDAASDRVQTIQIGETVRGKPMLLLFISSEENLRQLERWKDISTRLAMARGLSDAEARRLAEQGKAIVWIDGGMHSTERAHAQMTTLLAHRVATEESEEMRHIRENVIFLLMPVMNPDGLDIVAHWYQRNLGTPWETTGPPELYHHYVGHDNNRDWYMILQPETRAVARQLYEEWYPQIVYNQHQSSPEWTRIFVPPFADPINPRIPAGVITGVNLVGQAMHRRFAEKEMPGAISRLTFDMWWNGGMRTAPYYHNMIGILTETAHTSPTPQYYDPAEKPATVGGRRAGAFSTSDPSIFYPDPWQGGWSRFSDAINYMLEASMATLDLAAERKADFLYNMYQMGRDAVQAGERGPYAYVIPAEQWDRGEAVELVNVLRRGGVEVHRATAEFTAGRQRYPAGSYIAYAGQPFRAHLMDLLEKQVYPQREMYPGGPPEPPYDLAGWTLPMQMGVEVARIEEPFRARAEAVQRAQVQPGRVAGNARHGYAFSHRPNAAALAVNRLLKAGDRVHLVDAGFSASGRQHEAGTYVVEAGQGTADRVAVLARELGLDFTGVAARPQSPARSLRLPRIGIYQSWVPNMDEGWTRWVLEQYEFPVDTLHDADIRKGDLSRYDVLILADQRAEQMLNGYAPGSMPAEYVGGMGVEGAAALKRYVEGGGTIVALDGASDFAIDQFGLRVRNVVRNVPAEDFFIPGSLIRLNVDNAQPLAYGMQPEAAAFFVRSRAFQVLSPASAGERTAEVPAVRVLARYAADDLLMSGWAQGEDRYLAGRPAALEAELGQGRVMLIGFRPQFRGQSRGTYKLLLNALHQSTVNGGRATN